MGSVSVQNEKCVLAIPLVSGVFAERRWKTAYSTGTSGRHGALWGERGRHWAKGGASDPRDDARFPQAKEPCVCKGAGMLNEGNAVLAMGFAYVWAFKARPRFRQRKGGEPVADSAVGPKGRLETMTAGDISRRPNLKLPF